MPRLHIRKNGQWEPVGKDETSQPVKAVICFDASSNILGESLNITSIQRLDSGYWQHNFETPPPDGHYCSTFTSDYSSWVNRNDVCQIMKTDGNVDYCRTFTTVYNDSKQNCGRQSLRVYW